ncbi:MAG: 3-hydroxybutyrate dehydrogenase [Candidatus Sericytochromatia bacterium]
MQRNAVITGSTSGIGQGLARALAQAGYGVLLNGFGDPAEIEAQRAALAAETGVRVLYHGADMSQPEAIAEMMAYAAQELGSIDILVNNAGIQHVSPIEDFPIAKWDAILAINLSSAFHTIRAAVPAMKQRGWGRIINLASAHALIASPYKSAYVAAKHGIAGLTKTVALELAQAGVTCNAICPGYVKTPLVENQIADTARVRGMSEEDVKTQILLAAQPTREFTTVEELGALAVFLCTDAARNLTGALLPVDGGWSAQ